MKFFNCFSVNVNALDFYVVLISYAFAAEAKFIHDDTVLKNYNPCCSMPCQHRGICTAISNYYFECDCPKGYYGDYCEKSTITRWLKDKLNLDQTKKHKLIATGKLIWGIINNIPPLHDAALRHVFLSNSDLGGHDSPIWPSYHPYTTSDVYSNYSYFTRGLPPVPKECPTPLGIKGPRILPPVNDVFNLLLQRREFKPCPLGTNLMFVTFAQHLVYQFFKISSLEHEVHEGYISKDVDRKAFRSWVDGKLKTRIINTEEYPLYLEDAPGVIMHYPFKSETGEEVFPKWAMEHKMLGETPFIFAVATIWLREHNRVCDVIVKEHPDWNDERIYQTARCIILGELLTITAGEYFQHLAQYRLRLQYKPELYHHKITPKSNQMQFEFGLAFQWHHMLPDVLSIQKVQYNFTNLMFSNNRIIFEHGLDAIVDTMSRHPAGQNLGLLKCILRLRERSTSYTTLGYVKKSPKLLRDRVDHGVFSSSNFQLCIEIFGCNDQSNASPLFMQEMTYRNCAKAFENAMKQMIEKGRKARLHSLNDYRRFYGLKPYASFEELVGDEEMAQALKKLYRDVDAIEFVVGIFMEKHVKSVVPPTVVHLAGAVALRQILNNPIGSPDLWRPSTFGGITGFDIVQKASLRKLFCLNLKGNCRNNVWVSFKTPADVTAFSKKTNSALTAKK